MTALSNGNYAVISPYWNNEEGAVTWGSGTAGVTGIVSAANSLVAGGTDGGELAAFALPNGNYVVASSQGGEGAVTFGNGTTVSRVPYPPLTACGVSRAMR